MRHASEFGVRSIDSLVKKRGILYTEIIYFDFMNGIHNCERSRHAPLNPFFLFIFHIQSNNLKIIE